MARHHTKDKGDLGVAKAHADLVAKGFDVLFPATEHAPFDLVAHSDGIFHRIQVKYRSAPSGVVSVNLRSTWSDRHGVHSTPIDKNSVDTICIYCPETDQCYYLRPADHNASVTLRITPVKNGQQRRILNAADHRELPGTAQHRASA
ncbi:group I intron-associated PD-(D/E)XK endonuclease [Mycolicibacterium cosmeticum]|uniref:group I intron-associated PD-(D/E)XK endonuclease n=1 Tax=Mycolicibacterium cosmeticum TaxID=258533 RepID=UPI003204808B